MSMFILALILGRLNLSMLVNWKKQKGAFVSLTCLQLADQGKGGTSRKKRQNAPRFFSHVFSSAISALGPLCERPESISFKVSRLLSTHWLCPENVLENWTVAGLIASHSHQ